MQRSNAIPYVSFVVDDAGCARSLGDDPHAIVRESGQGFKYSSRLIGWQCGFEPLFVAVHSYLDVNVTDDEAAEMAIDYLTERNWFSGEPKEPDYIF
jgi:hypothetical protein